MSRPLRVYVSIVVLAGALALAGLVPRIDRIDWAGVFLWLALLVAADFFPLPSPIGGSAITGAAPITFASVLVFGPAIGALFGAMSALLTDGLKRRCPLVRVLFNAGQLVLALGFAGLLYRLVGGATGPGAQNSIFDPGWGDLLAVILAYGVFLVLNTGLVSIAIALSEGVSPVTILKANYVWQFPSAFSVPLTSFVYALLYLRVGLWPVCLFFAWNVIDTRSFATILELKQSSRRTLGMLASATDAAVPHLKGCSEAVAALGGRIAREMGLSSRRRERIESAGLLHNVGLLAVDRKLLLAGDPLRKGDEAKLRAHVERGAGILAEVPALRPVAELVRSLEERPDGGGYPRGLRGHEIPLEARVLRVAAAYEALTAGRPSSPRLSNDDALRHLEEGAGSCYDEQVVLAALKLGRGGHLLPLTSRGGAG